MWLPPLDFSSKIWENVSLFGQFNEQKLRSELTKSSYFREFRSVMKTKPSSSCFTNCTFRFKTPFSLRRKKIIFFFSFDWNTTKLKLILTHWCWPRTSARTEKFAFSSFQAICCWTSASDEWEHSQFWLISKFLPFLYNYEWVIDTWMPSAIEIAEQSS